MKRPLRLLQVEDSASDAALIVRLLEKADYSVHAARVEDADGLRQALADEAWDVIIADYSMPQFDAPAALAVLQQTSIDIPFIVVSGTIGEKIAVEMMSAGAHDYLMKDNLVRLAPAVTREVAEAEKRREARRVAMELAETHQLSQQIVDSAQVGIIVLDGELKHLVWNPYMEELTGLPAADVLGRAVLELFPGYRENGMLQALRLALAGEKVPPLDIHFYLPQTDHAGWVSNTFSALRNTAGQITGVINTVRNITQRKLAEEKAALFSRLIDDSLSEVYVFDAETFRFRQVNRGGQKNSGYSMAELAQMTPLDLKPSFTPDAFAKLVGPLRSGEQEMLVFNTAHRRKDGSSYPVEVHLQYFPHAEPPAFVAIILDVTEHRQMEEQVRQSQKMDAVGRLAGGVAHDFNNITQAILGFSDLLLESLDMADARRLDVVEIKKAALRAVNLTSQLLAFSRKQVIAPTVLDLNGTVASTLKMLQRLIGEDIRIETRLAHDLARVMADAGQMDQVILNLAVNARDAMPTGGVLKISTENVTLGAADAARLQDARPGDFVCLTVTDTGSGMSPEVMSHIFEPFFTTKGEGRGTGLGLSVIFGITQQHNGWVNVYSREGCGTTFKFYLPSCPAAAGGEARPGDLQASPTGRGERILLVEDEHELRALSCRILAEVGYHVTTAENARQARALLATETGDFDLLFCDVVLPDGNGIEFADECRQQSPSLPVLLSSGYTDDRSRWPTIEKRRFTFLQKPYAVNTLLLIVRQLLDARIK